MSNLWNMSGEDAGEPTPYNGKYKAAVIAAIDEHWKLHKCPPTLRDIASAAGVPSTSQVTHIIDRLEGITVINGRATPNWVIRAINKESP
jgi:SOS-response transcriptional repressor LexA